MNLQNFSRLFITGDVKIIDKKYKRKEREYLEKCLSTMNRKFYICIVNNEVFLSD